MLAFSGDEWLTGAVQITNRTFLVASVLQLCVGLVQVELASLFDGEYLKSNGNGDDAEDRDLCARCCLSVAVRLEDLRIERGRCCCCCCCC